MVHELTVLVGLLAASAGQVTTKQFELEVSAGPHARKDVPLAMELPESGAALLGEITPNGERKVPSQVESPLEGSTPRIHWILDGETPAGGTRRFRLHVIQALVSFPAEPSPVSLDDVKGKHLEVKQGGKTLLRYHYGKVPPPEGAKASPLQTRNAYLHPLWSPSGKVLTMDYPSNHWHHRGVWFPWVNTEFEGRKPDFWNLGDGTGTVEFEKLDETWKGPVFAGFRARHRHQDLKAPGGPKTVLREIWHVRACAAGGASPRAFLVDLDSRQECAGESPLQLVQYRYGGLGVRGSWDWEGNALRVITSEGKTRADGEGAPARWFVMGGKVGGEEAGIAVLGHPSNFRAPQPVRVHPSEPFLNYAPVKAGPFQIAPGKPYLSRYRFVLHDGVMSAEEAERHWRDYAEPPAVKLIR